MQKLVHIKKVFLFIWRLIKSQNCRFFNLLTCLFFWLSTTRIITFEHCSVEEVLLIDAWNYVDLLTDPGFPFQ